MTVERLRPPRRRMLRVIATVVVGLLVLPVLSGCGPSRPDDARSPTIAGVVQSLDDLSNGYRFAVLADGTRYDLDAGRNLSGGRQTDWLLLAGTDPAAWYYLVPPAAPPRLAPDCPFLLQAEYAWEVSDAMLFLLGGYAGGGTVGLRLPKARGFVPYELRGNPWWNQDWCVDTHGEVTRHP